MGLYVQIQSATLKVAVRVEITTGSCHADQSHGYPTLYLLVTIQILAALNVLDKRCGKRWMLRKTEICVVRSGVPGLVQCMCDSESCQCHSIGNDWKLNQ